jgi:hypothetical protein
MGQTNNTVMSIFNNKNVTAWMLMVSAVALHVIDETSHDFLPFYNRLVLDLRNQLGFFPAPTFSFGIWIGGVTTALGILMIANALGHIIGSIYFERLIPGFWSSPLLLPAAVFVVVRGFKNEWAN